MGDSAHRGSGVPSLVLMLGLGPSAGACARAPVVTPSPVVATTPSRCEQPSPAAEPRPGPIYALIEHIGLLEIGEGRTRVVAPSPVSLMFATMTIDPEGALWIGGWHDADLLRVASRVESFMLPAAPEAPSPHTLAPRARDDVWFATSEIEWEVALFDGTRLHHRRDRSAFTRDGGYDDNKLNDLARIGDTAYVACWNGLWRHDQGGWRRMEPPPTAEPDAIPWQLFGTARGLVVSYGSTTALLDADGWQTLVLPGHIHDINDAGLAVTTALPDGELWLALHSTHDLSCDVSSTTIPVGHLYDVALDERGRSWIATDTGLSVRGPDAEPLAHWNYGELPGLEGSIRHLVAVRGGPDLLPSPQPPSTWTLRGQLHFVQGGAPVAGRTVLLCPSGFIDRQCEGAPFVHSAQTDPDGSFRFTAVPPGDLAFAVLHPPHTAQCSGIFDAAPHYVSPSTDCPAKAGECDLGKIDECLPFEMPPPPGE